MLRPPGTNTPSMFRDDDVCSGVMMYAIYIPVSANMGDLVEAPFFVFF